MNQKQINKIISKATDLRDSELTGCVLDMLCAYIKGEVDYDVFSSYMDDLVISNRKEVA